MNLKCFNLILWEYFKEKLDACHSYELESLKYLFNKWWVLFLNLCNLASRKLRVATNTVARCKKLGDIALCSYI